MKIIGWIIFPLIVTFASCTDYGDYGDTDYTDWDKGGEEYYNKVMNLQTEAGDRFASWSQTMDSLEALKKLQQFFLKNSSVVFATIGSQGISVLYNSGMRGGVVIDQQIGYGQERIKSDLSSENYSVGLATKSVVNRKKAIVFFPYYWLWTETSDIIENEYNTHLPDVGFTLSKVYKNTDATIDRFTELSGYGIIHFDSHGYAWPNDSAISEIYFQSGERENKETTKKYWKEINDATI